MRDCTAGSRRLAARGQGRAAREGEGLFLLSIPLPYLLMSRFLPARQADGGNLILSARERLGPGSLGFPRVKRPPQPPGQRSDAYLSKVDACLVKADAIRTEWLSDPDAPTFLPPGRLGDALKTELALININLKSWRRDNRSFSAINRESTK